MIQKVLESVAVSDLKMTKPARTQSHAAVRRSFSLAQVMFSPYFCIPLWSKDGLYSIQPHRSDSSIEGCATQDRRGARIKHRARATSSAYHGWTYH